MMNSRTAVPFMWGSLRLAPMTISFQSGGPAPSQEAGPPDYISFVVCIIQIRRAIWPLAGLLQLSTIISDDQMQGLDQSRAQPPFTRPRLNNIHVYFQQHYVSRSRSRHRASQLPVEYYEKGKVSDSIGNTQVQTHNVVYKMARVEDGKERSRNHQVKVLHGQCGPFIIKF